MGPESTARKLGNGFTYSDYLTWPDEERWEIIAGEAYAMTPAPSLRHQDISLRLGAMFASHLKGTGCKVYTAPTDVVFDQRNVVQPDLLVVCDRNKLTEKNVQGAPDLIVEILSPGTALKDKREKKALYERYGVREYLVVYPNEELIERFVLFEGSYGVPEIYGWQETLVLTVLPDATLKLWEVFDRELPPAETPEPQPGATSEPS